MVKPLLLIRADASVFTGTGHVMRCIALAQAWQDLGGEAAFLSVNLPELLVARLSTEGIRLIPLNDGDGDAQITSGLAANAAWTVIDGYQFDTSYCERIASASPRTLVIDDLGSLNFYSSKLVLNQNITAKPVMYADKEEQTDLLLGVRYALLRREFRSPVPERDANTPCDHLLVTMGGGDPDNVTLRVIEALLQLPSLRATVVIGAANPRNEELGTYCEKSGGRITLVSNVHDMVPLIDSAHFTISAGGTSVLELSSRGAPTLLISIASNQTAICEAMSEQGAMAYAGWHADLSSGELISIISALTSPQSARKRNDFSLRSREFVDGQGALRVSREMMAHLAAESLRVRPATMDDARDVFEWANDPTTRAASFTSDQIRWDDHEIWFSRRIEDSKCRLLIGEDLDRTAIGMVRFDLDGDAATFSINVAPDHRQRGLGTSLILVACHQMLISGAVQRIRALIKPENMASQRAFQRAGFRPAKDENVAGQAALCMVLD